MGEWKEERRGKGTGSKRHKWQVENRQGEGKNSIGNGEAKELVCTTHGHELGSEEGTCWWKWQSRMEGDKEEKKWDNCNSIINKIYLKRTKIKLGIF